MKNTYRIMIFLCIISYTTLNAQICPQQIFNEKIILIEKSYSGQPTDGKALIEAVIFLQDLTGIKSNIDYGEPPIISPSMENLNAWKKWYTKNKNRLYWDKNKKKVMVKGYGKKSKC